MPTKRIGPGRTVAPLRPPPFANVRDLGLKPPMMMAFPESRAILLRPDAAAHAMPASPLPALVVEVPAGERLIPQFTALQAVLPSPILAQEPALEPAPVEGMQFERPVAQPWPGTRPLRPVEGRTALPDSLAALRPLLEAGWQAAPAQGGAGLSPRAYQIEAAQALLAQNGLLLADDPGTGKTVAACQALAASFQRGAARVALVVCAGHGLRHWDQHLATWAPSLLVTCVHGPSNERALDWRSPAHVYVADYDALAEDFAAATLPEERTAFDVVVLDDALLVCSAEEKLLTALGFLKSKRRWALASALPEEAEDWLALFGFLTPGDVPGAERGTPLDMRQRFAPSVLRRTRVHLGAQLPRLTRQEVWIDLDEPHLKAYREAEGEERRRLEGLGRSATTRDVIVAVEHLKQLLSAVPGPGSGSKSRAIMELVREIAASGGKAVLFCGFEGGALDRLQAALGTLGVTSLLPNMTAQERANTVEVFREHPAVHLLLAEPLWMADCGPLPEVGFAVHYDPAWNPAVRVEVERRLWPETVGPVHIYEFWTAETVDEGIHAFLAARGLLAGQAPAGLRPTDFEAAAGVEAWLDEVFGMRLAAAELGAEAVPIRAPELEAEAEAAQAAERGAEPSVVVAGVSAEQPLEAVTSVSPAEEFLAKAVQEPLVPMRVVPEAADEKEPAPASALMEVAAVEEAAMATREPEQVIEEEKAEAPAAAPIAPEAELEGLVGKAEPQAEWGATALPAMPVPPPGEGFVRAPAGGPELEAEPELRLAEGGETPPPFEEEIEAPTAPPKEAESLVPVEESAASEMLEEQAPPMEALAEPPRPPGVQARSEAPVAPEGPEEIAVARVEAVEAGPQELREKVSPLEEGPVVPPAEEALAGKPRKRLPAGVDSQRAELLEMEPEALLHGVERWMVALGFQASERTQRPGERGGEFVAGREAETPGAMPMVEYVLVRCVRSSKNVGIAQAKALVLALAKRPECGAGYLVVTSDFTSACKKLADESAGQLVLISGPELWRSLHILGLL